MSDSRIGATRRRLKEVLLTYLAANITWPGADGLTVQDALAAYRRGAAADCVPGLRELLERHAELADELHAFFRQAPC
jgi:hypothetical protein